MPTILQTKLFIPQPNPNHIPRQALLDRLNSGLGAKLTLVTAPPGFGKTSIIGVLWGSLHLALLLPGMMDEGTRPLPTLLGLVGGSVLFTWLYVNSGGNIKLTTLFHAAQSFFVIVNEGIPLEEQM